MIIFRSPLAYISLYIYTSTSILFLVLCSKYETDPVARKLLNRFWEGCSFPSFCNLSSAIRSLIVVFPSTSTLFILSTIIKSPYDWSVIDETMLQSNQIMWLRNVFDESENKYNFWPTSVVCQFNASSSSSIFLIYHFSIYECCCEWRQIWPVKQILFDEPKLVFFVHYVISNLNLLAFGQHAACERGQCSININILLIKL